MSTLNAGLSALSIGHEPSLEPFTEPDVDDVLATKDLLRIKGKLPNELVDCIIDYAEYWPHTTTEIGKAITAGGSHRRPENIFALRSFPLGYHPKDTKYTIPPSYFESKTEVDLHPLESDGVLRDMSGEVLESWMKKSGPRGEAPCRKIVFTFQSADQGWGGFGERDGAYGGSYTWLDVGKECIEVHDKRELANATANASHCELVVEARNGAARHCSCILRSLTPKLTVENHDPSKLKLDHPFLPENLRLQSNMTAAKTAKNYTTTWSYLDNIAPESQEGDALESQGRGRATGNGEYVRNLKIGEIVTIWARARFPGWVNKVTKLKMDVYWAV